MWSQIVIFVVLFLTVLDILFYLYLAYNNRIDLKLNFFGADRKQGLGALIIMCLIDGIIIGIVLDRLLFR